MDVLKIIVKNTNCTRIDKYIAQHSNFSRTEIQHFIDQNLVLVNNNIVRKSNFQVHEEQEILVKPKEAQSILIKPEKIFLDIVYEDEDIIIINKKSGMVVHPAPGHYSHTLVNALMYHFNQLSQVNNTIRPGIVHRIDKDTSGLLIIAKNNLAHRKLAENFKTHQIKRTYLAWVEGILPNKIIHIDLPIGRHVVHRTKMTVTKVNSKKAVTHVYALENFNNKTLVKCELETGRTHQIRVHLAHINHPIVGDYVYGRKKQSGNGQLLHAYKLKFKHPITNKELTFQTKHSKFQNYYENK